MKRKSRIREVVGISSIILLLIGVITLTSYISKSIFMNLSNDNNSYVLEDMVEHDLPVVEEIENKITKPFNDTNINVEINFYENTSDERTKEKSLILYDNTYMPSTGILYTSDNTFDVLCIYDGTVEEIKDDEMLGKVVTIKHTNNLISKYSSLKDVTVEKGEFINTGEIIGTSSSNKIINKENSLLLEIIEDGKYVNPINYYDKTLESIN